MFRYRTLKDRMLYNFPSMKTFRPADHINTVALFIAAAFLSLSCAAQPPAGYYDAAEGLSGQPLRIALHGIIDNHTPMTYAQLWTAFQTTDVRPDDGKVWDIYSDIPGGTPPYEYTFVTDQCGNYNGEGDCYNREHSFPQSWFNGDSPMYTDIFHIYPTDGWVNNKRGNLPYGDVGSADYTSQNGSKSGLCVDPGFNGTVFEPIDAYKGDLARSYFYMMTRYYGEMSGWNSPVVANGDLVDWEKAVLVAWSDNDPVSQKEIDRNDSIYLLQGNRNPFIDNPQWVHAIWGVDAGISEVSSTTARIWSDANGLHVGSSRAITGTLRVTDLLGRVVLTTAVRGDRSDIAFNLAPGVYMADLEYAGGRRVQRFAR
jgi:endonuclease I